MTLNNWLCKTIDKEHKGYVTIGNVLDYYGWHLIISFVGILVFMFASVLFAEAQRILPPNEWNEVIPFLIDVWKIPVMIFIGIIVSTIVIYIICSLKIAKCPKKGD